MKSDKIMAKATKKPQCSVGRPKAKVDVEILKNLDFLHLKQLE